MLYFLKNATHLDLHRGVFHELDVVSDLEGARHYLPRAARSPLSDRDHSTLARLLLLSGLHDTMGRGKEPIIVRKMSTGPAPPAGPQERKTQIIRAIRRAGGRRCAWYFHAKHSSVQMHIPGINAGRSKRSTAGREVVTTMQTYGAIMACPSCEPRRPRRVDQRLRHARAPRATEKTNKMNIVRTHGAPAVITTTTRVASPAEAHDEIETESHHKPSFRAATRRRRTRDQMATAVVRQ